MKDLAIARIQVIIMLLVCSVLTGIAQHREDRGGTIDKRATSATKALFQNLKKLSANEQTIFGQQDATWYGIGWKGDANRSDVKSVTGSHPGMVGWDLMHIVPVGLKMPNAAKGDMDTIRMLAIAAYERGAINTFSWHMHNPVTMKNMYDTTPALATLLPGGINHAHYKLCLDAIAVFFQNLRGSRGELIPVIFRPFHEHNGNWFWWCKPFCTPDEYKQLIRFTVKYLRDTKGVHNVLYAYSTDKITGWDDYMERYAGDDCFDVLGMDNYWEFRNDTIAPKAIASLRQVVQYAVSKGKIPALTETGLEKVSQPDWFTSVLWRNIRMDSVTSRIAYLLVWRNAHTGHFYTPYPGHNSEADFKQFFNDPATLFEQDLPDMYHWPK